MSNSFYRRLTVESSRIVSSVLKRYPQTKKRLKEYRGRVLESCCRGDEWESDPERKGEKLTSPYIMRMEREVLAVEKALENLTDCERAVIEARYFKSVKKNEEFLAIEQGYARTSISRVSARMKFYVALYLGEVSPEEADFIKSKTRRQSIEHSLELMARLKLA